MSTLPSKEARLLVVDDNEMNRDMLSRRLRKQGHQVEMAEDGKHALEMVRSEPFDLVLLDIMMPEMDGFEVLETLKADPALRHIPVIMISASEETASVVRCIELGAEDYLPKPFNPVILRARVDASLEKKRLRDREQLYAKSMERELEIGRTIQQSFFPESIAQADGYEIGARFTSARQVAGDFYDVIPLSGGRIGLVIADVCDKGVGAALFMALFRSLIRAVAAQEAEDNEPPESILMRTVVLTNDYIAETHSRANMFATTFFAVLDPATGVVSYINGGHEAPLIIAAGSVRDRLAPTGAALGMMAGLPFTVAVANLAPGETLLAYTDGVTEARGQEGLFGEDRLLAVIASAPPTPGSLLDSIGAAVVAHAGDFEQSDDITLLAVRRAP
jgi:serine phosphatase RsbU (regulator of sigma subunit)